MRRSHSTILLDTVGAISEKVEARTQELGRLLYQEMARHGPSPSRWARDSLMGFLTEDETLRNRLLRFTDVLAALDWDRPGWHVASLFRECFSGEVPSLPALVRLALRASTSPLVPGPVLAWAVRTGTQFVASQFIAAPGGNVVQRTLGQLNKRGSCASFDLLGEAVLSDEEARQYKEGYLRLLEQMGRHPLAGKVTAGGAPDLEVSLKLSSLSCQFNPADPEGVLRRVRPALEEIFETGRQHGIGVTVDAEQYEYRDLIWHILSTILAPAEPLGQWPGAGVVVQAYLKDAESHAQEVIAFARRRGVPLRIRLVKGAYWDHEVIVGEQLGWPIPVWRNKGNTDLNFERLVRLFLPESSVVRLAVGSHNIRVHAYAEAVRESVHLPEQSVEHQTLYRTMETMSRAIPRLGWAPREYVPVGELIPGMAYLVRRILENTSQMGFLAQARLAEDPATLLRPPEPQTDDPAHSRPPHPTGFTNTPSARLFDAEERHRFAKALDATRRL